MVLRLRQWKEIEEEEIQRLRRRRIPMKIRRFDTKSVYNDIINQIPPGKTAKLDIVEFCKKYGIELTGLSEKLIKKRIRGILRAAIRKRILKEFHVFGKTIIVTRSEITAEELKEELEKPTWLEELEEE